MLKPYWIDCVGTLGVGVTAQSEEDALTLLEGAFGSKYRVERITEIHDASELDQNHVVPNMGSWLKRGVWFPLGYEHIAK